jgi:hypothetical protein
LLLAWAHSLVRVLLRLPLPSASVTLTVTHITHTRSCVITGVRLADYARLEASAEHKDVFFLGGPTGSGQRSFFLDADLAATKDVKSWLEVVRRKWHGMMNENEGTAVSMTITGTPKARLLRSVHLSPSISV